jgi:hypothetical protein
MALFTFRYIHIFLDNHLASIACGISSYNCSNSSFYNCSVQVEFMPDDAHDDTESIYFEAYPLWLFGSVMFSTHAPKVQTWLLPYAKLIARSPIGSIPKFSWGSAMLAGTYRGLCNACISEAKEPVLTGSPMLIQIWSYERFKIGHPCPANDV